MNDFAAIREAIDWTKVTERHPPPHAEYLFKCDDGRTYIGSPCYGMHAPWWCIQENGHSVVLNDRGVSLVEWFPLSEVDRLEAENKRMRDLLWPFTCTCATKSATCALENRPVAQCIRHITSTQLQEKQP